MMVGLLFFASCQEEDLPDLSEENPSSELNSFLGKKLENPYSVKNMRKAYASLLAKNSGLTNKNTGLNKNAAELEIDVTDFYVKFHIKSDDDLQKIIADSLNYSVLPLDHEIVSQGDIEIGDTNLNSYWVYTSVPTDYNFHEEIEYEILEELFLPESVDGENGMNGRQNNKESYVGSFLYALEEESLLLTGNLDQGESKSSNLQMARTYRRPQGYIRVQNTTTGTIDPVIGVKVKTRRWFKWGSGYTDSNGFYSVDNTFERDVNYEVVFKNSRGFKIWPSMISISSGRYNGGKHSPAGQNITFTTSSDAWRFATVNNATVHYLNYCNQFNVGLPHSDLRIVAQNGTGSSSAPMLRRVWGMVGFTTNSQLVTFLSKSSGITIAANLLQNITKFIQPDLIIKSAPSLGTASIYSTTFHELAHASHFRQVGSGFWVKYINYIITYGPYGDGSGMNNGVCAVGEMWGFYYGYFLTLQHFGNNNNNPIIRPIGLEDFTPVQKPDNRSIVIHRINNRIYRMEGWIPAGLLHDLIDTNADIIRSGFTDNVSGYTISQIFGALRPGVETVQGFRNRLLQNNGNHQQQAVNNLFEAYYYN
ncbi:hypothetical protein ACFOUP_08400 [Belliella kenyensis]|uniref:Uncharacterized protein n=1 Tax=Belliella kenyensis TaxID=1472724 RepID=A0ABV8EJC8_9BACT|nr:hypothetical protein [Belliella kenyensis]MCH7403294.1 hypothetical protein [Belliella kenyensis]MDN3602935.1 hypothetical protein [Belliella kenyensis]